MKIESGTANNCSALDTEFSLLEEEFFWKILEESDNDMSDSEITEEDDGMILQVNSREMDVDVNNTCGCSKKNGAPCCGYFDQNEYEEARMSMAVLENSQLDLVILSHISAHHFSGQLAGHRTESQKVIE